MWVKRLKPEDFNRLLRIYQDPREAPALRGQAAEALTGRIDYRVMPGKMRRRDAVARQAFLRGLDDAVPEVRLWSIFALANPENEWLVSKLESMTSDPALVPGMYTVGQEAQWAIRSIRREEDIDPEDL
jgi:HEAT repeat protein